MVFSLDETGIQHHRIIFGMSDYLMNIGGLWFGMSLLGHMFVRYFQPNRMIRKMAKKFYRKPEVYKYAHAEKLEYSKVVLGQMTEDEFNKLQEETLEKAEKLRTRQDIEGKIIYPSFLTRLLFTIQEYMDLPRNLMIKVDQNCFERAKTMITNEMLDVRFIGD